MPRVICCLTCVRFSYLEILANLISVKKSQRCKTPSGKSSVNILYFSSCEFLNEMKELQLIAVSRPSLQSGRGKDLRSKSAE